MDVCGEEFCFSLSEKSAASHLFNYQMSHLKIDVCQLVWRFGLNETSPNLFQALILENKGMARNRLPANIHASRDTEKDCSPPPSPFSLTQNFSFVCLFCPRLEQLDRKVEPFKN